MMDEARDNEVSNAKNDRPNVSTPRKCYSQKWKESWTSEPQFAGWLAKSTRSTASKDLAYCKICRSDNLW